MANRIAQDSARDVIRDTKRNLMMVGNKMPDLFTSGVLLGSVKG